MDTESQEEVSRWKKVQLRMKKEEQPLGQSTSPCSLLTSCRPPPPHLLQVASSSPPAGGLLLLTSCRWPPPHLLQVASSSPPAEFVCVQILDEAPVGLDDNNVAQHPDCSCVTVGQSSQLWVELMVSVSEGISELLILM
ncbi:unnamed protein product [Pleuronectes platessa]|uniref:Uncharacterized protein n=1 Tax=Pleuronectes platessa TaxID=8262 RepID=A0A9N7VGI7_PLEPL|nr:unnamed protein product [Pleuronectes platessa]